MAQNSKGNRAADNVVGECAPEYSPSFGTTVASDSPGTDESTATLVQRAPLDPILEHAARYDGASLLGQGGMGEVHLVHDRWIGRDVAMKKLRSSALAHPELEKRFLREASIQGQLEHPNIVPVYDLGVDEQNKPFFTMRRLGGQTLDGILTKLRLGDPETCQAFSRHRLLTTFVAVCHAMEFAHARGVIHRDLKPANIMLGGFGEVYVLDWGIAKLTGSPDVLTDEESIEQIAHYIHQTRIGTALGTAGYMAPEQHGTSPTPHTPQSDVYALGAILYELVTLEPLHHDILGDTEPLEKHDFNGSFVQASNGHSSAEGQAFPKALEDLWLRATRIEPSERLGSVREMREGVENVLASDRVTEDRKARALQHLRGAQERAVHAHEPGTAGLQARKDAIHELGRSLSLDPAQGQAAELLGQLLAKPPSCLPDEIQADEDADEDKEGRGHLRTAAALCITMGILLASVMLPNARDPWACAAIAGTYVLAGMVHWCASKASRPIHEIILWPFLSVQLATVAVWPIDSPMSLLGSSFPALMVMLYGDILRRQPRLLARCVGLSALASFLPVIAEGLGYLDGQMEFPDGRTMVIHTRWVNIDPLVLHFADFATYTILATVVAWRWWTYQVHLEQAEEEMALQTWQLRQLLPPGSDMHLKKDTATATASLPQVEVPP